MRTRSSLTTAALLVCACSGDDGRTDRVDASTLDARPGNLTVVANTSP